MLRDFASDTSGAVTVDWVVLTGAVVGLGIATTLTLVPGIRDLSGDIAQEMQTSPGLLKTRFGLAISNGSFEDIAGMRAAGWGFYAQTAGMAGWSELNDLQFEVVYDGYNGIPATDGGFSLDMDASPGNLRIGQDLSRAVEGQTYTVSFTAADAVGNNGVNVYFGGQLVGEAKPTGRTPGQFSYEIVGGAGDGSNRLELEGTGPANNVGAYIDNIVVD